MQDLVVNENDILLQEIIDLNQNVQDALILLKIWLTQKNLGVSLMFIYNVYYTIVNIILNFRKLEILPTIYFLCTWYICSNNIK